MVCTIAQGGKANDAHVDTDCTLRCRYRFFIFCLDGNVPFVSSPADGGILDPACDVTTFSVVYPSYLRQVYPAVVLFQFDTLRIAELSRILLRLNRGKSVLLAKKFLYAASRSFRLCWSIWLWQSFSLSNSRFHSGYRLAKRV